MVNLFYFVATHAIAGWLIVTVACLLLELATMSGWLLWPAASAGVVALVTRLWSLDLPNQAALFAVLTLINTLLGRTLVGSRRPGGRDPNDADLRVLGLSGRASSTFKDGAGRVKVDGKEWAAEVDGDDVIVKGAKIYVTAMVDGARVRVRRSQPPPPRRRR